MRITVKTDRTLIRAAGSSSRYLLASVVAPEAPAREKRLPVNVAFVLDRSGSMEGDRKFALARQAIEHALDMLTADDRFSIVVYDTHIDVVASSAPATRAATRDALDRLSAVDPRGGTDLGAGWLRGCEEVARFLDRGGVNRCLLLTDGLANSGITERGELSHLAAGMRERGVITSTFGVGADFDEHLLRDMAHEGGGNTWFIEGAAQIPEIITSELGEALEVTLREAALVITTSEGCSARPLNRFRHRSDNNRHECRIELGDLVSGQKVDAVIEVAFPAGTEGAERSADVSLVARGEAAMNGGTVIWTFAGHRENDAQPRDVDVDRAVATQYAARARAEATEANRAGDFGRARRVLERTARRISGYAGRDRDMRALSRTLREEVAVYAEDMMSPLALKMSFYMAESSSKGRGSTGRARRG